jgi:ribosome-associated toxin RatA of RatAB toxin-antitoxin module
VASPAVLAVAAILLAGSGQAVEEEFGRPHLFLSSLPDGRFLVEARMPIHATPAEVRAVVTDYDALASFMPKIEVSRTESRQGNRIIVHQEALTSFILLKRLQMTLEFTEASAEEVRFRILSGSLKEFDGAWRFFSESRGSATLLHYRVVIRPGFRLPAAILRHVAGRQMEEMMPAIAREVARRSAAPPAPLEGSE